MPSRLKYNIENVRNMFQSGYFVKAVTVTRLRTQICPYYKSQPRQLRFVKLNQEHFRGSTELHDQNFRAIGQWVPKL